MNTEKNKNRKKMENNVTNLALKHVYYEQIRKGLKTVEYRDLTEYYIDKFLDLSKYPNMTHDKIKEGLVDGELKIHRNGVKQIMFFENGRKMLVPIKDIKVYKNHPTFCIEIGKPQLIS